MRFDINEDGVTGSALSGRGRRSKNSYSDRSDEESLGDNDWKEFCRAIRGQCAAGLTDCRCESYLVPGIVFAVARSGILYLISTLCTHNACCKASFASPPTFHSP